MTQALDQSIMELLDASQDDAATMEFPVNDRTFGFHAQQSIEKLIKALIAGHGVKFEFTHDLRSLIEDVAALGEQLPVDLILVQSLTNYAGVWRYQEPQPMAASGRVELLKTVARLRSHVEERLAMLRPGVDWAAI
jgi:HEPN domain-containing protein